ncbi:MAG: hypothetical protein JKY48_15850, partial [Flavobacteriales bacterium]|nr:hypothetical protein [Flavobacteriales bacterium]
MKQIINFFRDQHSIILKALFFCLSVGLIVFIFPQEGKFKYEFQKGKPWQHDDLIAPFDFPIYKSDAEISQEREVVKKQQKTYFFKGDRIQKNEIERFYIELDKVWQEVQANESSEVTEQFQNKFFYLERGKFV